MAKHVIIVGAGIIGASVAYQLVAQGARVTVIDGGLPRATDASFGWINASFFLNEDHYHLRREAIKAFQSLSAQADLPVDWSGCLLWQEDREALETQRLTLTRLGYAVEQVDAARFADMEPSVSDPPMQSLFLPLEAAAESGAAADILLQKAVAGGARILSGVKVKGFTGDAGAITGVTTGLGPLQADQVVVAAGVQTEALMQSVDIAVPLVDRPALVIQTRPVRARLNHILVSDIGEVRQTPDGALMLPVVPGHQQDDSDHIVGSVDQLAQEALARLQGLFPREDITLARVMLAHRPVPEDGLPVVGAVRDGLYVAVMHSGITLAALMGELIAAELTEPGHNRSAKWLGPYRPNRFANQPPRA